MKLTFDIEPVEQARPRATRMGKGIRLSAHSIKHIEKRTRIADHRSAQAHC